MSEGERIIMVWLLVIVALLVMIGFTLDHVSHLIRDLISVF